MSKTYSYGHLIKDLLSADISPAPEPRKEMWASDLGKPFIDRFLKMKGVPYTNPMTGESMQNMILGRSAEDAFIYLLKSCSIPTESQNKIVVRKDGCLPVTGRLDVLTEVPDWDKLIEKIEGDIERQKARTKKSSEKIFVYDASSGKRFEDKVKPKDYTKRYAAKKARLMDLIKKWQEFYPNGLPTKVAEVKTIAISAMKYNKAMKKSLAEAYPQYVLQLYTYILGLGLDHGTLIFIVKGTGKNKGWVEEVVIKRSPKWDKLFWDDVEGFSKYFYADKKPPLEPLFNAKGHKNWQVSWSSYYDMLYKDDMMKAMKEKEDAKKAAKAAATKTE